MLVLQLKLFLSVVTKRLSFYLKVFAQNLYCVFNRLHSVKVSCCAYTNSYKLINANSIA